MITMVGNIRRWKGQHIVLAAVERLPAAVRDRIHVLCVGAASEADAGYFSQLQELVHRAQLTDTVQFLGARPDVPNLLAASDIAVHASILPEPFGLVVVEAMTLGVPVVALRLGAPLHVVTSAAGLLYDPSLPDELADQLYTPAGGRNICANV